MQGVILPPKGHFVMSEDIFDFPNSGQEDAPGISHSLSLFFLIFSQGHCFIAF